MAYNWQLGDWPNFTFQDIFEAQNKDFAHKAEELLKLIKTGNNEPGSDLTVNFLVDEIIASSRIEGENYKKSDILNAYHNQTSKGEKKQVRFKSSMELVKLIPMQLAGFGTHLSEELLFAVQVCFLSDRNPEIIGRWRSGNDEMHIVSGSAHNEKIHFTAPPPSIVKQEMHKFFHWYNETSNMGAIEKAAIAHLYFETIHPLVDGNGRVGRHIALSCLFASLGFPVPLYLSEIILNEVNRYYKALNQAQNSNELTQWICYFAEVIAKAQDYALMSIGPTFRHNQLLDEHSSKLNARQHKALEKMFAAGPTGFKGGMSAQKYISINKVSKATATRDLKHLFDLGILKVELAGRSTRYNLDLW
ncbi:MAG: Fic family protein [Pedobacter sp.]|nr:MAG: Fic family protein [Pedobacter sp.]